MAILASVGGMLTCLMVHTSNLGGWHSRVKTPLNVHLYVYVEIVCMQGSQVD